VPGRSASPASAYDIAAQARRVGAALDRLGVSRVTVIGHSTGGTVATALAEQRPDAVAAQALINTGPSPDAYIDQGLLGGLLLAQFPGRLLWRLRTEAAIRKAMRTAFTRPVDIPDALIEATLGMTHRAVAGTARVRDEVVLRVFSHRAQFEPGILDGTPVVVLLHRTADA